MTRLAIVAAIALAACGGGSDGDRPDAHPQAIDGRSPDAEPADAGPDAAPNPDAPDAGPPAVVAVACPDVPDATVGTSNFAYTFDPSSTIDAGDIVHFVLEDIHNARSDTGLFTVGFGGDACFRFDLAGSYPFHCTQHPSVAATLVVQ